jgi:hypothetical protein
MKQVIYNAIKESKLLVPKYPEVIGVFEKNLDAVTMIERERLKIENNQFNFYIRTVKGEAAQ